MWLVNQLGLLQVMGRFAFVIFDPVLRRVWAARDQEGVQPLYWGTTTDGRFLVRPRPCPLPHLVA